MKDLHVDKIMDSVHAALGDLEQLHEIPEHLNDAMGPGFGFEPEGTLEREFPVQGQATLSMRNLRGGSVRVQGIEGKVVRVRSSGSPRLKTAGKGPWEAVAEGDTVEIRARSHGHGLDFDIEVPYDCALDLQGLNPDIDITGTRNAIGVKVVSGDIHVANASGPCELSSVSGDITCGSLTGALSVETTSGDAVVTASRLKSFKLASHSGDFIIDSHLLPEGQYQAHTTSGDVRLRLPSDSGVTVRARTTSGEIASALPAEIIRADKHRWEGTINGGGPTVEMTSVSGSLHIEGTGGSDAAEVPVESRSAETEETPAPTSSGPDASPAQESAVILASLERGEITVDEAMRRLDAASEMQS